VNHRATRCVLLADKHHGVIEGVRGLLETAFGTVFMVGDEASLIDGVERLEPSVIVVDLAIAGGNWLHVLRTVRERSPMSKVIVLSMYDEFSVVRAALGAGANGFVLKRTIATDMLDAIEAVLGEGSYISPCIHAPAEAKPHGDA
jgi:DNA-binding NarL/FixJ family response regulator